MTESLLSGASRVKISEPLKGWSPTTALTTPKPVSEVPIMAALQPTCALPLFPVIDGVRFAHVAKFVGYAVSDDGFVWSCKETGEWHKLNPTPDARSGHIKVGLTQDGKRHSLAVHRLILEAFVGPCPPGMQCCHDPDRNPANNCVRNLRWDTPQGNADDKVKHGTIPRGENAPCAVLTDDAVRQMRILRRGQKLTTMQIADQFGVSYGAAYQAITGSRWTHITDVAPVTEDCSVIRRGTEHHFVTLDEEDVLRIVFGDWKEIGSTTLARMIGVHEQTVRNIRRGFTWSHLTGIKYEKRYTRKQS